jgi:hypothetical protein
MASTPASWCRCNRCTNACDDAQMHVLMTRRGELCMPFGGICANCTHGDLASVGHPTELVTVADHDISLDDITAAAAAFLDRMGWFDEGGECAADMATGAAEIAADYPPGTRLRPRFDHTTDGWIFTPEG